MLPEWIIPRAGIVHGFLMIRLLPIASSCYVPSQEKIFWGNASSKTGFIRSSCDHIFVTIQLPRIGVCGAQYLRAEQLHIFLLRIPMT